MIVCSYCGRGLCTDNPVCDCEVHCIECCPYLAGLADEQAVDLQPDGVDSPPTGGDGQSGAALPDAQGVALRALAAAGVHPMSLEESQRQRFDGPGSLTPQGIVDLQSVRVARALELNARVVRWFWTPSVYRRPDCTLDEALAARQLLVELPELRITVDPDALRRAWV